jgi:hypothetical protein
MERVPRQRKYLGTTQEPNELPATAPELLLRIGQGGAEPKFSKKASLSPSVAAQVKGDRDIEELLSEEEPAGSTASRERTSSTSASCASRSPIEIAVAARRSTRASCFIKRCSLAMARDVASRASARRDNNTSRADFSFDHSASVTRTSQTEL